MSEYEYLEIEAAVNGVAKVFLNRPPANAIHQPMYREIFELFSAPEELGDTVQCIILAARGRHFCAGNDLQEFAEMTPENGVERMRRVRQAFFAIQDCRIPVIGAVHGAALGTGLAIAASCDFVVAASDALFGLPELTVGVFGGARHLARIAPEPLVRRMFFTGEHLRADVFAQAGGSINICPPSSLLDEAERFARRIASFSPAAVRIAKRVLNSIEEMDLKAGYEFEQSFTVEMSGHPDAKEALKAFAEGRLPMYRPLTPSP